MGAYFDPPEKDAVKIGIRVDHPIVFPTESPVAGIESDRCIPNVQKKR